MRILWSICAGLFVFLLAFSSPADPAQKPWRFSENFETLLTGRILADTYGALNSSFWSVEPKDAAGTVDLSVASDWNDKKLRPLVPGSYAVHSEFGTALGIRFSQGAVVTLSPPDAETMPADAWMQFKVLLANTAGDIQVDLEVSANSGQDGFQKIDSMIYTPSPADPIGVHVVSRFVTGIRGPCGNRSGCKPVIRWRIRAAREPAFVALDDVIIGSEKSKVIIPTTVIGGDGAAAYLRRALETVLAKTGWVVVTCDDDTREQQDADKRLRDENLGSIEQAGDKGRILTKLALAGCKMPPVANLHTARLAVHDDARSGRRELILTIRDLDNPEEVASSGWVAEPVDQKLSWTDLIQAAVVQMKAASTPRIAVRVGAPDSDFRVQVAVLPNEDTVVLNRNMKTAWRVFWCYRCEEAVDIAAAEWSQCVTRPARTPAGPTQAADSESLWSKCEEFFRGIPFSDTGAGGESYLGQPVDSGSARHFFAAEGGGPSARVVDAAAEAIDGGFVVRRPGSFLVLAVAERDKHWGAAVARIDVPPTMRWRVEAEGLYVGNRQAGARVAVVAPIGHLMSEHIGVGVGGFEMGDPHNSDRWWLASGHLTMGADMEIKEHVYGGSIVVDAGIASGPNATWAFGLVAGAYLEAAPFAKGLMEAQWWFGLGGGVVYMGTDVPWGFGGGRVERRW
jgi:hypothetical protein